MSVSRMLMLAGSALIASAAASGTAISQAAYPDRPVKIMLGFPAGSGADILCRYFVDRLAAAAGSGTFIIENKPGASGNIAVETAARSKPDGYTLLMAASSTVAGSPHMYKSVPWDPQKDLEPITTFAQLGFVLTIAPSVPAKTVAEFTQIMKAKSGKATFGFGNPSGLAASSLYAHEAGFQVTSVAYKSNPQAVSDVSAGQTDYVFSDAVFAYGQERAGKVKLLAVTSPQRLKGLPDIPTMAESGLGNATIAPWWALFAPTKTPPEILAKLGEWMNKLSSAQEAAEFLIKQGAEPLPGSAAKTREMVAASLKEWARLVTIAKIDPQ